MTKSEFTSGPWFAIDYNDDTDEIAIESFDGEYVCHLDCDGAFDVNTGPRIQSNAHLIAAAPDLYEVAVDALKVVELLSDGDEKEGGLTQRLRAALAKARGEEA